MKNSSQAAKLLEHLTQIHLFNNPDAILQAENFIRAFGIYDIYNQLSGYCIYKNKVLVAETSTAKAALSWCIADKYTNKNLAKKIERLDNELSSRRSEIQIYKNVIQQSLSNDRRFVVEDKLQISVMKAKHLRKQLDNCINLAKYYQLKGFENETSRLGLKTSSRKISEGI